MKTTTTTMATMSRRRRRRRSFAALLLLIVQLLLCFGFCLVHAANNNNAIIEKEEEQDSYFSSQQKRNNNNGGGPRIGRKLQEILDDRRLQRRLDPSSSSSSSGNNEMIRILVEYTTTIEEDLLVGDRLLLLVEEEGPIVNIFNNNNNHHGAAEKRKIDIDISNQHLAAIETTIDDIEFDLAYNWNLKEIDIDSKQTIDYDGYRQQPYNNNNNNYYRQQQQVESFLRGSSSNGGAATATTTGEDDLHDHNSRHLNDYKPYGIKMVQADKNFPDAIKRIKVCVVDTGYEDGHKDLPNLSKSKDGFTPREYERMNQDWYDDNNYHGTHVAGTIGALGGNDRGVESVLNTYDRFQFYIGKGLTDDGWGYTSTIIDVIDKCVDKGAQIINLSLGGGSPTSIEEKFYKNLYNDGVLLVAAAGNDPDDVLHYPASYKHLMSVAAVDKNEKRADFSSFASQVEISAPGEDILSTIPKDRYAYYSGTSMASPHVAGVAALVWGIYPECSNAQIRNVLLKTAKGVGCNSLYGHGIVQAKDAYELIKNEGCEAGNKTPKTPSDESYGGCKQSTVCDSDLFVKLVLHLDNRPQDISHTLTGPDGPIAINPGGYTTKGGKHEETHCIVANGDYTFKIMDSKGDGLKNGGDYKLYLDDTLIKKGGNFNSQDTHKFTVNTLGPPPSTPSPTPSPTNPPTGPSSAQSPGQMVWSDVIPLQTFSDKTFGDYFNGGSKASAGGKKIVIKDDVPDQSYAETKVLDGIAGANQMRLSFRYKGKKLDSNDFVKIYYRYDQGGSSSFNANSGWSLWYKLVPLDNNRENDDWYDITLSTIDVPDGKSTIQIYFESGLKGSKHKIQIDDILFEKLQ